jgi:hypothetical protein
MTSASPSTRYQFDREENEKMLPAYILRLTGGYEYRTYW